MFARFLGIKNERLEEVLAFASSCGLKGYSDMVETVCDTWFENWMGDHAGT